MGASLEQTACEDLKAFERRLIEVVSYMQPSSSRWRVLLVLSSVCTAIGAYYWLTDPSIGQITLMQSLYEHIYFTTSLTILLLLFMCGIHKRVVAPSIIASRCRQTLAEFNMSCDDTTIFYHEDRDVLSYGPDGVFAYDTNAELKTGKLILKPRPSTP